MRIAAYSFYYGSLAVLLALSFFGLFLGDSTTFWVGPLLLVPGVLVGALLLLVHALIRPSWLKARELVIAVGVAAATVYVDPAVSTGGVTLFWATREDRATAFVAELLSYGRIQEMDDGQRYYKELNGELVAYTSDRVDTSRVEGLRPTLPVQTILTRDRIDPRMYERFRQSLQDLKLIHLEVHEEYIGFVYDGLLDNLHGFVWVRPGHHPPPLHSEFVDGTALVLLRPLGNGWYYFATT